MFFSEVASIISLHASSGQCIRTVVRKLRMFFPNLSTSNVTLYFFTLLLRSEHLNFAVGTVKNTLIFQCVCLVTLYAHYFMFDHLPFNQLSRYDQQLGKISLPESIFFEFFSEVLFSRLKRHSWYFMARNVKSLNHLLLAECSLRLILR